MVQCSGADFFVRSCSVRLIKVRFVSPFDSKVGWNLRDFNFSNETYVVKQKKLFKTLHCI